MRVNYLSWPAEVFYRRLMSVVDDFGRYHAHPALLRAACYPLQLDKVSEADIGKWLGETRKAALVSVYESSGMPYLELLDFKQQKRAEKSKFPPPDQTLNNQLSECEAEEKRKLTLDEGEGEGEVAARGARATRLGETELPEPWRTYCLAKRPDLVPEDVFEDFRDYWVAKAGKDGTKLDWAATWRKWVRNTNTKPGAVRVPGRVAI